VVAFYKTGAWPFEKVYICNKADKMLKPYHTTLSITNDLLSKTFSKGHASFN
jgi:hypothetical protein